MNENTMKPRIMYALLNKKGNIRKIYPYLWWFEHEEQGTVVRISLTFDTQKRHVTVVPHTYERLPK